MGVQRIQKLKNFLVCLVQLCFCSLWLICYIFLGFHCYFYNCSYYCKPPHKHKALDREAAINILKISMIKTGFPFFSLFSKNESCLPGIPRKFLSWNLTHSLAELDLVISSIQKLFEQGRRYIFNYLHLFGWHIFPGLEDWKVLHTITRRLSVTHLSASLL